MNTFLLVFVAAAVVWTVVAFNRLVARRNLHRSAWSDIDVQLLRRHELVPQLVDVVRAHAAHEKDTLTTVAELRSRAMRESSPAELGRIESALEHALHGVFALKESYPGLRASELFLQLQHNLADIEEQVHFARRFYNGAVRSYNTTLLRVPDVIIARLFRFRPAEFYQAEEAERVMVNVELG
jgi:LemA protein